MLLMIHLLLLLLFILKSMPLYSSSYINPSVLKADGSIHLTCGAPYPFGTAGIALPGFEIGCPKEEPWIARPFLSISNNTYDIQEISLQGYIKIFAGPIYTRCFGDNGSKGSGWLNLDETPFALSYQYNMLTVVGCNNLVSIRRQGENLTATSGCVTFCDPQGTFLGGSCSGLGCCQATLPGTLKSFDLQFKPFNVSNSSANFINCSAAFFSQRDDFKSNQSRFLFQDFNFYYPHSHDNNIIQLDWAIGNKSCEASRNDIGSFACKNNSYCYDSPSMVGYLCNCSQGYEGNPYAEDGCTVNSAAYDGGATDNTSHCKSVPYPFGEQGVALKGFEVDCPIVRGSPIYPLLLLPTGAYFIQSISLEGQVRILTGLIYQQHYDAGTERLILHRGHGWLNLTGTPFTLSKDDTTFIVIGCNDVAVIKGFVEDGNVSGENFMSGCVAYCSNSSSRIDGSCSGLGCCQMPLPGPGGLKSFELNLTTYIDEKEYIKDGDTDHVVVLNWAIGDKSCEEAKQDVNSFVCKENSQCFDSQNGAGYLCNCSQGYEGNPYAQGGCTDIDECQHPEMNPCTRNCINTQGSVICGCPSGMSGDGRKDGSGCKKPFPLAYILIPYPFGAPGVALKGFEVACTTTRGSLLYPSLLLPTGTYLIQSISLQGQVRILTGPIYQQCYDSGAEMIIRGNGSGWLNLSGTPFTLSKDDTTFILIGCNDVAVIKNVVEDSKVGGENFTSGCVAYCSDPSSRINGSCSGIGCCQMPLPGPGGLKSFELHLYKVQNTEFNGLKNCSAAFFATRDEFYFRTTYFDSAEYYTLISEQHTDRVVVLNWAIGNYSCEEARKDLNSIACKENSQCYDSPNGVGYLCNCSRGYEGNPYVHGGCRDVDECQTPELNPCSGNCINTEGSVTCACPSRMTGDGRIYGSGCKKAFPLAYILVSYWYINDLQVPHTNINNCTKPCRLEPHTHIKNCTKRITREILIVDLRKHLHWAYCSDEILPG
ncbi:Wall-associated receptor kinase 3 [Carex littledalei]|uniref:Wall-associated receptor kinase 3 n=1 Tax=Carex littledalei TaxID=544730 RepID=A0A833R3M5_9POAL|nr:Wall-associated receptor kinase 3 [Carex littledalei]